MKIYAMSDIHGFLKAFFSALERVDLSGENQLVLLGDYIDYGPNSREVVETIMDLQKKYGNDKIIALSGNHEKDFLDWLEEYADINAHLENLETYKNHEWLQSDMDSDYVTLKSFLLEEHWKWFSDMVLNRTLYQVISSEYFGRNCLL